LFRHSSFVLRHLFEASNFVIRIFGMSDLPVDQLLTVDQAIAILDAVPVQPRMVKLPMLEAMGFRLAEDVFADRDYPPFDKALMDGFAVRSSDATAAGAELSVIDTIAAGQVGQRPIGIGEAAAIMTGAPVPVGADAVVPIERISRNGSKITVHRPATKGQSIARAGSDAPAEKLLLAKGILLGPVQLGVAATVGLANLAVYDAPSVAILSTGDELIEIDRVPTGAQIRNSNSIMMHALLRKLGCRVRDLGMVRDDPAKIRSAIEEGLQSDALFITGGMSMGEHDYVPRILQEIGLKLVISKLRIKPGKPFAFATNGLGKRVFGLPGNPVSAYVCTLRLARRVLTRLSGGPATSAVSQGQLIGELPPNGPRELYLPAYRIGDSIQPLQPNGSADLFTLAYANCLILRAENAPAATHGNAIVVLDFP
jgi:molybdopterin molybdotransferase